MRERFLKIFELDLRALSLLRIGIAIILIADLLIRFSDLRAHYSDEGVLPLKELFANNWNPERFSFHNMSGMWQVQAILFLIATFFAFSLMVGYQVQVSTFISWILLLSLHNRNHLITQGGDDLLRLTLFWGMFLPWGEYFTLKSLRHPQIENRKTRFIGIAGAAYMLQIALVYFVSALLKNSAEWTSDGTAIYYALSLDQILLPFGRFIYPYYDLLKYLTFGVYYVELIVPFFFFMPYYTNYFRCAGLILIFLLHVGISITLFVGLFFVIGSVTLLGMIPVSVMDNMYRHTNIFKELARDLFEELEVFFMKHLSVKIIFRLPAIASNVYYKILRDAMLVFFMFYILLWNAGTVVSIGYGPDDNMKWVGNFLRLDQNWGMFAPTVFKDDGWFILEGSTKGDTNRIDLNRKGKPVNYKKPEKVVSLFKNDRWRKYSENYLFVSNAHIRPYYCWYAIRKWNKKHPEANIDHLKVVYMKEVSKPNYEYVKPKYEVLCECDR